MWVADERVVLTLVVGLFGIIGDVEATDVGWWNRLSVATVVVMVEVDLVECD